MTPTELIAARKQLGLTQSGLAAVLGLTSDRTVRKWEAGEIPIGGPSILALRYMLKYGLPDKAL